MPAARKSSVSTTGTRLRQDSTPFLGRRRSTRFGSTGESASTLAVETSSVPSRRRRRSAKDLSIPATLRVQDLEQQQMSHLPKQSSTTQKSSRFGSNRVPAMPTSGAVPLWLLRYYKLNRYSSVVTFLLVAATLVVYGCTVYSQELWSQDYRRLQNLHRNERQLTTTNATLTNKMAEEAERPTAGLVSPTPARTIFLPLGSKTPLPTPSSTKQNPKTQQTPSPLGY